MPYAPKDHAKALSLDFYFCEESDTYWGSKSSHDRWCSCIWHKPIEIELTIQFELDLEEI